MPVAGLCCRVRLPGGVVEQQHRATLARRPSSRPARLVHTTAITDVVHVHPHDRRVASVRRALVRGHAAEEQPIRGCPRGELQRRQARPQGGTALAGLGPCGRRRLQGTVLLLLPVAGRRGIRFRGEMQQQKQPRQ